MFTLVRRFIKTGIGFLFAGLLLGAWMLVRRELFGLHANPFLSSAHVHAVGIGFVMFLILGVALWLFPRPPKEDTRYRPGRIELAYWLLTLATVTRFATEIARSASGSRALAWVVVGSGLGQVLGLAVYFYAMWPRIRPLGSRIREEGGERF